MSIQSNNNRLINNLPKPFYYKGSDILTQNEYRTTIKQIQGNYCGSCIIDIQTLPLYDTVTNVEIGTCTFYDYVTKSSPSVQATVSEKIIFNFNNNSSIITEYSFLNDDFIYPTNIINQRIVSGTGNYLNLFNCYVHIEKKPDDNRYISIISY